MRRTLVTMLCLALAGCGRDAPVSAPRAPAGNDAEARIGDLTVHASIVQTSMLDADVSREYGLERSDRVAMLLVSARGADGAAAPAGVSVTATVSPSGGMPQALPLREVRAGGLVDRVGTVDIAPPESLRFDVTVHYDSATSTMQLTRDFFPR